MGRYIERAEHFARYSKVIYFSALDAPILKTYDRDFVQESMLYMAGIFDMESKTEKDVLFKIGLDAQNSNSIISNVSMARENAHGARSAISTELWEAINRYYHLVISYPVDTYLTTGFYEFTQMILDQTSIVRGKIYGTLLHEGEWAIILIGMYIERVVQVIRIINSKLNDVFKIEQAGHSVTEQSFEWTTLLKCVEAFDMNRKHYASIPDKNQVLEFLLLNQSCPRSISNSLSGIMRYEEKIRISEKRDSETIGFKIGKLQQKYQYLTIDDFKDNVYELLNYTQEKILEIGSEFEKKYLSY
ncbi:MAG: alpha-E domain-containing protein [Bacteroidales bacterium]|nr:alpha-E domain-containing protein [Bacteroidales bacterium]